MIYDIYDRFPTYGNWKYGGKTIKDVLLKDSGYIRDLIRLKDDFSLSDSCYSEAKTITRGFKDKRTVSKTSKNIFDHLKTYGISYDHDFNDKELEEKNRLNKSVLDENAGGFTIPDNFNLFDDVDTSSVEISDEGTGDTLKPQEAHIETKKRNVPSFIASDIQLDDYEVESEKPKKQAPPIVPNGTQRILPQWRHLSYAARFYLRQEEGIETVDDYNEILNDPTTAEAIKQSLKCKGLL